MRLAIIQWTIWMGLCWASMWERPRFLWSLLSRLASLLLEIDHWMDEMTHGAGEGVDPAQKLTRPKHAFSGTE